MHRNPTVVGLLVVFVVSGCITDSQAEDSLEGALRAGECLVNHPDGSPSDCEDHAQRLRVESSTLGALCSDEFLPGVQGTVRILRDPVTAGVYLVLDLHVPGTHGVVQLGSDPDRLWAWTNARGDESWSLGSFEQGETFTIQAWTSTVHDVNHTDQAVQWDLRWTTFDGEPWAVTRLETMDKEYFFHSMARFVTEARSTWALAHFDLFVEEHRFQGRHDRVVNGVLGVNDFHNCSIPFPSGVQTLL